METLIMWVKKKGKKPHQVGVLKEKGGISEIINFSEQALAGKGKLYLVDAENVDEAIELIKQYPNVEKAESLNNRIFVIGENALKKIEDLKE